MKHIDFYIKIIVVVPFIGYDSKWPDHNKHRPLNEVLQFLEKTTDIHFEISGKNITVSKIKKG